MHLDSAFSQALVDYDLAALDAQDQTIYGVDAAFRLRFTNRGWNRFARANDGASILNQWPLGRSILDGISPILRPFYANACQAATVSGKIFEQSYQCPTPMLDRTFDLVVYPLKTGLELGGWLFVHAEIQCEPHRGAAHPYDARTYLDADGLVHQCAHCRKVLRTDGSKAWDWVKSLVGRPHPRTSHGLCQACLGFYYPMPLAAG